MNTTNKGVTSALVKFAIPYMIAAFLQTLYGLVDLFVVGLYNNPSTTTAVSVGSQIMHLITVIILGLILGITVQVGNSYGAGDRSQTKRIISTAAIFFMSISVVVAVIVAALSHSLSELVRTPAEALTETSEYVFICGFGILFIFVFNILSGIFRGVGDSKSPMYAVATGGLFNIILDFVFVGFLGLGAKGAAIATITGQLFSCIMLYILYRRNLNEYWLTRKELVFSWDILKKVIFVGIPVALQDGFIQVAFMVITVIANSRGLVDAAAVGVVEKLICFFFLVPSAFMSAISALTAQYHGAANYERARHTLKVGLIITVMWGIFIALINQIMPYTFVSIFTKDELVRIAGVSYLRAYAIDTAFAAIHFCFSGYFAGIQKSYASFIHNLVSVLFVRIPGSYIASISFPMTLFPMGLAAPAGSLLSAVICIIFYNNFKKKS